MRLSIVGTGKIVQTVLPFLKKWGWEPEALCATARSEGKGRELAERYACPQVYTDYSAMLKNTGADTVYLGVPNDLHMEMAMKALEAGKNVILEKPITLNYSQTRRLSDIAREKGLFLYEAITTLYQPDFIALKEQLERVGEVRLVSCNFSQYSSRYDAFRQGQLSPALNPAQGGGALMDLNIYNLHWLVGLFGEPEAVRYYPNWERGVDTSGVLVAGYPGFQAVSLAAKSCGAPCQYLIEGSEGYLLQTTPANECGQVTLHLRSGGEETFHTPTEHRMEREFRSFARQIEAGDLEACYLALEHSLTVSRVLTRARESAGLRFPGDLE